MGSRGQEEASVILDEPDVIDGGDVVGGVGVGDLASGSSSTSGCLVV